MKILRNLYFRWRTIRDLLRTDVFVLFMAREGYSVSSIRTNIVRNEDIIKFSGHAVVELGEAEKETNTLLNELGIKRAE